MKTMLTCALQENGYSLTLKQIDALYDYLALLTKWNRVFNLTAITDFNEAVYRHILDSLSLSPYLHGERLIDVGTGAGLPGIPLAILHPEKHFVLLDSNNKKTRFLLQAKVELSLNNIEVVHSRCESFHPSLGFDSIMSRAFASINDMLISTEHLLANEGHWLAMKGVYPLDEIAQIPERFNVLDVQRLSIKGLDAERHVVRVTKKE